MPLLKEPRKVLAQRVLDSSWVAANSIEVDSNELLRFEPRGEDGAAVFVVEQMLPRSYATHCGVPIIPTTAFYGCELYCMECGTKLGILSPLARCIKATPELHGAYHKVAGEWDEHVGPYILPDGRKPVDDGERKVNEETRTWLERRRTQ